MRFFVQRRRPPPSVIIVSLIDILIVLLIFLIATTSFKNQPAIQLKLPEASEAKPGADDRQKQWMVTVAKDGALYLGRKPVSEEELKQELRTAIAADADSGLAIRADTEAPFGQIVKVMNMATELHFRGMNFFTESGIQPK